MLTDYSIEQVSGDIAGLAANLSIYRDSFSLLAEQIQDIASDEITDQLLGAGYFFAEAIELLDNVSEELLEVEE